MRWPTHPLLPQVLADDAQLAGRRQEFALAACHLRSRKKTLKMAPRIPLAYRQRARHMSRHVSKTAAAAERKAPLSSSKPSMEMAPMNRSCRLECCRQVTQRRAREPHARGRVLHACVQWGAHSLHIVAQRSRVHSLPSFVRAHEGAPDLRSAPSTRTLPQGAGRVEAIHFPIPNAADAISSAGLQAARGQGRCGLRRWVLFL
jgi:hypothetical protein